jgi:hypothetical protein
MSCIFLKTGLHKNLYRNYISPLWRDNSLFIFITLLNKTGNSRTCINTEARFRNLCGRGKAVSITHSERVSVALVIQNVKRIRRVILSSVARPSLLCFVTLFHNRHNFRKIIIEHNVFCFSTNLFLKHLSF